jgi:hypothetical protein
LFMRKRVGVGAGQAVIEAAPVRKAGRAAPEGKA